MKKRLAACIAACALAVACAFGIAGCAEDSSDKEEALAALDGAIEATNGVQNVCFQDGSYNLSIDYMGSESSFDGIIDVHYIVPGDDSSIDQIQAAMSTSGEVASGSDVSSGDSTSDNSFSFNAYMYESNLYFDFGGSLLGGETEKLKVEVTEDMLSDLEDNSDSGNSDGKLQLSDFADCITVKTYDGTSIALEVDVRSAVMQEYSSYLYEEYGEGDEFTDFEILTELKELGDAIGKPELVLSATIASDGTLSSISMDCEGSMDPLTLMSMSSGGYHDFSSFGYSSFFGSSLDYEFSASIPTVTASADQSIAFPDFSGYQSYEELEEEYGDWYDYGEDGNGDESPDDLLDDVTLPHLDGTDDDAGCGDDASCDGTCDGRDCSCSSDCDACSDGACDGGTCDGDGCDGSCSGCDGTCDGPDCDGGGFSSYDSADCEDGDCDGSSHHSSHGHGHHGGC